MLKNILTIAELISSVALIVIVLLQSGKEAGLGAIAGSSETYMGKNKSSGTLDQKLASATKWIALLWVALTLALQLI